MERLYLGRESRMVWEGLFILKNPKGLLGSKMGDVGKIRRWDAEEGEERKQKRAQLWQWGVKR